MLAASRLTAVLITWLVGVSAHPFFPAGEFGTLGVFIPSSEGLIVAADSRSILAGHACDDALKIIEGHRAAVVIGGLHLVREIALPRIAAPCDEVRRSRTIVDFHELLR